MFATLRTFRLTQAFIEEVSLELDKELLSPIEKVVLIFIGVLNIKKSSSGKLFRFINQNKEFITNNLKFLLNVLRCLYFTYCQARYGMMALRITISFTIRLGIIGLKSSFQRHCRKS